jgi:hypothetical protein
MEALVARLSQLDADAEGALRVVTFFDTLMRRRVDLPALARASAGLAECCAGIRVHGTGHVVRMAPDGRESVPAEPPPVSTAATVTLDDEEIGTVWLERRGATMELDELLLDRLAIAVAAAVERYGPAQTTMADPALVELAISSDCDAAARDRALRLMGFAVGTAIRVVAVRTSLRLDQIGALICPTRQVKAAQVDRVGVLLAATVDSAAFPDGARAGIGDARCPDESWRQARTALRFTSSRQPVAHYAELGAVALLADVPEATLRNNADVSAVARLASDADDLATLDAYCTTGSLRRAADLLHLHHSSVARRLDLLGKTMGFGLNDSDGLMRAHLALTAYRLVRERL